jgi:DNA-binding NarL/FixJ family response regulator
MNIVPPFDGRRKITHENALFPNLYPVVVLTMYATDRAAALASGADAFLLKGCPTAELLEAVMPGLP